jgi:hypothetical protein
VHADQGPAGAAIEITGSPEFASCAAQRVASAFLGRAIGPDDDALMQSLETAFTSSGFKMKALVRALVTSNAYRTENNFSSTEWRKETGGKP